MKKVTLSQIISSSSFFLASVAVVLYFLSFEIIDLIIALDFKAVFQLFVSHPWTIYAEFLTYIALCIIMITCKSKVMAVPFFLLCCLNAFKFISDFDIVNVLYLIVNILMLCLIFIKAKGKHIFYLPSILCVCCLVINFVEFVKISDYKSACIWLFIDLLVVAGYILCSFYIVNTHKCETQKGEKVKGYFDVVRHTLLLFFTFGIWNFIWIYRTTKFLNSIYDEPKQVPIVQFFLCMVPFYPIYWGNIASRKIDRLCLSKNINTEISWICTFLMTIIIFLPPIIMQNTLNKAVTAK